MDNSYSSFLDSIRPACEQRHMPIISSTTQQFLTTLLGQKQPRQGREIGSCVCFSSILIAGTMQSRWWTLSTCEISHPHYLQWLDHIEACGLTNIHSYPFNFMQIPLENFIYEPVDFVFIDGMKTDYINYLQKIRKFLSENNTIVLDDVVKFTNKLTTLYTYLDKNQINYQIHHIDVDDWVMVIDNMPKE